MNGTFDAGFYIDKGWTHVVVNYIGPRDGQGTRMFSNGAEVASDTTKETELYSLGGNRIVVGRWYTDSNEKYAGLHVDELMYFNTVLSTEEVYLLYLAV